MTSLNIGVLELIAVVSVARHCIYLPAGSQEVTGDVPPTEVQDGPAASLRNRVSDALTSNVISVEADSVSVQINVVHIVPVAPLS